MDYLSSDLRSIIMAQSKLGLGTNFSLPFGSGSFKVDPSRPLPWTNVTAISNYLFLQNHEVSIYELMDWIRGRQPKMFKEPYWMKK